MFPPPPLKSRKTLYSKRILAVEFSPAGSSRPEYEPPVDRIVSHQSGCGTQLTDSAFG